MSTIEVAYLDVSIMITIPPDSPTSGKILSHINIHIAPTANSNNLHVDMLR